jgi:AraC family transcriptional regulator, regulatory protein of adaptative response / methylated-DNA-[protein]-cysteine methyltransferase
MTLTSKQLNTPLGQMIAVADEKALYLLEFVETRHLEKEMKRLQLKAKTPIVSGRTKILDQIEKELTQYFQGKLISFKTPYQLQGSPFQRQVWEELKAIPTGETRSYFDIAVSVGIPTGYRAVAQANGANKLAIMIPCHRVINKSGALGGYGGGLSRKQWLLNHEKQHAVLA